MEKGSFKHYLERWLEIRKSMEALTRDKAQEKNSVELFFITKRLQQLETQELWHREKLGNWGSGSIIEITGKIKTPDGKNGNLIVFREKEFSVLLVNTSIEDAKGYFENIVKEKYTNVILETISFKQLPVGILKINV